MEKAVVSPDISFVVPTYREVENLAPLVEHIKAGMAACKLSWELIIANDESGDATAATCATLQTQVPLKLLNRTRDRGLALAVIDGVALASGEFIVVMDADQSHPATLAPTMVEMLRAGKAELVIGSRLVAEGSVDSKWPLLRKLGTFCATALARPLAPVRDPMSGYFAIRRDRWPTGLRPIGYKICLEIIATARLRAEQIIELPIHFTDRKIGQSKMGARELLNYLRHLFNLYRRRWPLTRFILHSAVGVIGTIVDILVYLALQGAGSGHLVARVISYWPATVSNWALNRAFTYDDRPRRAKIIQLVDFIKISLIGFFISAGTYHLLTAYVDWFTRHKLIALATGVVVGLLFNYFGSTKHVFGAHHQERPKSSS